MSGEQEDHDKHFNFHTDPRSQIYRHMKTGGLYVVLHWDARIFAAPMDEAIVYQNLQTGQIWVRSREEFTDDHFACVPRHQVQIWGAQP